MKLFLLGLMVMFAVMWSRTAPAEVFGKTFQEVVERAKQERELHVWWSTAGEYGLLQRFQDAFKKRFGWTLEVHVNPLAGVPAVSRFVAEARVGRAEVDVLFASWDVLFSAVRGVKNIPGLFAEVERPLVEVSGQQLPIVKEIVLGTSSFLRRWAVDAMPVVFGIGYNTKLTSPKELPKTMDEFAEGRGFAEPKWKGRFGLNIRAAPPINRLGGNDYWDLEKAKRAVKLLLANEPLLMRGSPGARRAVATGEVAAFLGAVNGVEGMKMAGYPIDHDLFDDVVPVSMRGLWIPKDAKHPNAALLWVAFILQDGYPMIEEVAGEGSLADPRSKVKKFISAKSRAKIFDWTPEEIEAGKAEKWRKAIMELLP